jgi:hypothetical protein
MQWAHVQKEGVEAISNPATLLNFQVTHISEHGVSISANTQGSTLGFAIDANDDFPRPESVLLYN